jgi:hypothetical protein
MLHGTLTAGAPTAMGSMGFFLDYIKQARERSPVSLAAD